MCLKSAAMAGEQLSKLLCIHDRYRVYHRNVEVNINVELKQFAYSGLFVSFHVATRSPIVARAGERQNLAGERE